MKLRHWIGFGFTLPVFFLAAWLLVPVVEFALSLPSVWEMALENHEKRPMISLDSLPDHVVDGYLGSFDPHFYDDTSWFEGNVQALITNLKAGRIMRPPQSLVVSHLIPYLTDRRRAGEHHVHQVLVAWYLQDKVPKHLLLIWHLSWQYFGCGVYGIEDAAQFHFGKSATKLTRQEAQKLAEFAADPRLCDED